MAEYNTICLDCACKCDSYILGPLCPACSSTSVATYIPEATNNFNAGTNNKQNNVNIGTSNIQSKANSGTRDDGPREYIIYYVKYGKFKVMHRDSHFYTHSQNLNELCDPNSGIRYYSANGAAAAIDKMKFNSPDWDLRFKKILNL